MIRITTLGAVDLRDQDGTPLERVLRQPRRFALLVFMALESRRGCISRDRLLAMFWPELPPDQGRNALSQALHHLRRALGVEAIVARGPDDLLLDSGQLECDVAAFLAAADADRPETAIRLFDGEFLPAFFCGGSPAFEEWLDRTRTELRRRACECGWTAAERASERCDWVSAAAFARRAAALTEDCEASTRRLMAFLADIGDRAGALAAYDALVLRLLREHDAQPAAATRRLAETIRQLDPAPPPGLVPELVTPAPAAPAPPASAPDPAEPAEPIPATDPLPAAASPAPSPQATSAPAASSAPPLVARAWASAIARVRARGTSVGERVRSVVVTLVLMFGFVTMWAWRGETPRSAQLEPYARLVVEEPQGTLSEAPALTAELARQLAGGSRMEVLVSGAPVAPGDDRAVELALRSTVTGSGDDLRATIAVVDRTSGKLLASTQLAGSTTSATETAQLAARISAFTRRAAGAALERRRAELAGIGEQVLTDLSVVRRQIAVADSLASAGLRDVARIQLASADSQLMRIERRAPDWIVLPLERAELALTRMWVNEEPSHPDDSLGKSVLENGIAYATRAIELDEQDARGFELRGVLRYFLLANASGEAAVRLTPVLDSARADLERATRLSSGRSRAWTYLSHILVHQGDFAQGYATARRALEADEFFDYATAIRMRLFETALELSDFSGASAWCRALDVEAPNSMVGEYCQLVLAAWNPSSHLGSEQHIEQLLASAAADPSADFARLRAVQAVIYARTGATSQARTILNELEREQLRDPHLTIDIAWVHTALGQYDEARRMLRLYAAENPPLRNWVLRSGRFAALPRA